MHSPTDNIRCGSTVIRYYSAYGGWMLPDRTLTKNPLKAHRIAEETEEKKEKHKQAWEPYEVELLIKRNSKWTMAVIAKKLDRTKSDIIQMLSAISAGN
ncbi:DUF1317 family protein [Jejubacter calystegiae]|uniref:DUF1317 family protein n=1 Tax=Jejubacter calystegiae TaxID=2579935 RepID=A0A4P8YLY8_9ENTR|nr:DUF1317 family protein [Jejubacter calystegiae]QCT21809.1 DUF1317 family protein [Jejubacter calystegiae]